MTATALATPDRPDDATEAAFARFCDEHPDVYRLFCTFAERLKAAGHKHYSSDAILHAIRWHYDTTAHASGGSPVVNNNYSSRFARRLIRERPEFGSFFRTRKLASERAAGGAS